MKYHEKRRRRNAESKNRAVHDGDPWSLDDLEWLQTWDGTEDYLQDLADLLGRTIEACREKFYTCRRRSSWTFTVTTTTTVSYQETCDRCWLVHAPGQEDCV